jgi:adenylylsulfate kinase-like enzyme
MNNDTGFVVWLTGRLSGAGKTAIANTLVPRLAERGNRQASAWFG